jgi:hypothetical protein
MTIDSNKDIKKKINSIGAWVSIVIGILAVCYFGYYKCQQSKVKRQWVL